MRARRWSLLMGVAASLVVVACCAGEAAAQRGGRQDALARKAELSVMPMEEARERMLSWAAGQNPDAETMRRVAALWGAERNWADAVTRTAETAAVFDARVEALVATCSGPRDELYVPDVSWLDESADEGVLTPTLRDHLRLYYGRWLVQERMYDEAVRQLAELDLKTLVDPAGALFYLAVAYHGLLEKEAGLAALDRLLHEVAEPPARFVRVGELMKLDLEALEDDTLGHIAHRMGDIERRLSLGHAGPRVREIERGVVESLDKLIEEMEQAAGGGGASASSGSMQDGGPGNSPANPAQDSRLLGGKGAGNVQKRRLDDERTWGDLPSKDRDAAMQQIGRDFPAHYRDVVEQYFRGLASGDERDGGEER